MPYKHHFNYFSKNIIEYLAYLIDFKKFTKIDTCKFHLYALDQIWGLKTVAKFMQKFLCRESIFPSITMLPIKL
jgi:hypothetical protein